ncbi:Hypothetical predicted protein [Olea europaea subsp. europaea]|uniref:Uncharacterized protein n=1 Tax=Olea europaea subsp. europaea TaxID=158383 RepID=A0A8S0RE42_OLEEU|nr:Hypothetical predicted protein [Olea europaea subsp. europaea]
MAASKLIIFVLLLVATVSVESEDWLTNCKTHGGYYCHRCGMFACTCEDYAREPPAPAPTPAIDASDDYDDMMPVTCVTQSGNCCTCDKYLCDCYV